MSAGAEDTRTLQPGDSVRVVVETVVGENDGRCVTLPIGDRRGSGESYWLLPHGGVKAVQVYRLPKPLPPEPPVGTEVLGQDGEIRFRRTGTGWCSLRRCVQACDSLDSHEEWRDVLVTFGPLRLLGDPIEAPR